MTMTTLEVKTFLFEIGELRGVIGRMSERVDNLERMFASHAAEQESERATRRSWVRWIGTVLAALSPGALLYWLQHNGK